MPASSPALASKGTIPTSAPSEAGPPEVPGARPGLCRDRERARCRLPVARARALTAPELGRSMARYQQAMLPTLSNLELDILRKLVNGEAVSLSSQLRARQIGLLTRSG